MFISCTDNTNNKRSEEKISSQKNIIDSHDTLSQMADTLKIFPNESDNKHFIEVISLDTIRLSTNKINISIVNHLQQNVYAGQSAYFEKKNGSNWFRINFNKNKTTKYIIVSNAIGYDLKPTERVEINHLLFNGEYEYVEGIYRICFFIKIKGEKDKRKICKNFYLIYD